MTKRNNQIHELVKTRVKSMRREFGHILLSRPKSTEVLQTHVNSSQTSCQAGMSLLFFNEDMF